METENFYFFINGISVFLFVAVTSYCINVLQKKSLDMFNIIAGLAKTQQDLEERIIDLEYRLKEVEGKNF